MPIDRDEAIRRAGATLEAENVNIVESFDGWSHSWTRVVARFGECRLDDGRWVVVFPTLDPPGVDRPHCCDVSINAETGEVESIGVWVRRLTDEDLKELEELRNAPGEGPLVGLLVQLRVGPEFGPDDGMSAREDLVSALESHTGEYCSTDSGSRSTNVKLWAIKPEKWDAILSFTMGVLRRTGLLDRATVVRLDYVDVGFDKDHEWGPETVVWPPDFKGEFRQWPEFPSF